MKQSFLLFLFFSLLFSSCFNTSSEENIDQEAKIDKASLRLLEKDKEELENSMDSYKVLMYKFGKISLRSSLQKEFLSEEHQEFQEKLARVSGKLQQENPDGSLNLSALDYLSIFRDYRSMKNYIEKTDEDIFPILSQGLESDFGKGTNKTPKSLSPEEKLIAQNFEHAVLSGAVMLSRDFGKEIALYECSKTKPELLPESELKALMQYYRGFLFFDKGLYYLSESEISDNIDWLNNNPNADLTYTRAVFNWVGTDNKRSHTGFLSMNYLFRGFDRLMMDREIDEARALQDFEAFLKAANELGINNESTWAIEAYLYLKTEESEKAIASLTKLKSSKLLSSKEQKSIDESIEYLKNRKAGSIINKVYDKYFLSKIVTKYMFAVLSEVDWKKILKDQEVPYSEEAFNTINSFKTFIRNMEKYTNGGELKDVGKEFQETGTDLFNKAKEMIQE